MGGAGFRGVLAVPEFRALWSAELLSVAGDQLARVGLAVLVYTQTGSAGLTALTYAFTFLPALVGGVLLGGLADRFPRRELMVVVDLVRAVFAGLMAIPSLPLPVLLALVFLLTLGGAPFKAAQQALLPTILSGERYVAGLALRTVTNQSAQVAGFLGGGALVAVVEPHLALGLNALTFVVGALVVLTGVTSRPAARRAGDDRAGGAARLIWRDPWLRGLTALSWLAGLFIIPEGLAAPYAAELGVPVAAVGLLMAAVPVGSIAGGWLVARVGEGHRDRATWWFALAAGVPLALCLLEPPLAVVTGLWAVSGAFATGYLVLAQAAFVLAVPDGQRGAASGLAGAGVLSSQGVAVLGAGILADMTSPVLAVAAGGVAGIALTGLIGTSWRRARTRRGQVPVGPGGRETDDAVQSGEFTSPNSATSHTPPLRETTAEHGDGQIGRQLGVTSPSYASRVPPLRTAT
ncbi:MFS transporter, partial [Actinophytocola sediminis]